VTEIDCFRDLVVDGKKVLKLNKDVVKECGFDLSGSEYRAEEGCCEHGDEPSTSIKEVEILE
jgi:hypothetical protein